MSDEKMMSVTCSLYSPPGSPEGHLSALVVVRVRSVEDLLKRIDAIVVGGLAELPSAESASVAIRHTGTVRPIIPPNFDPRKSNPFSSQLRDEDSTALTFFFSHEPEPLEESSELWERQEYEL